MSQPVSPTALNIEAVLQRTFVARAERHAVLASTNDRAAECAKEGVQELPLLIVADEQTAGRGRGANRWWTGLGGLAFTLLLAPEHLGATARSRSPLAALATAVAVVETVTPLVPDVTVGIHWPNDVMAAGRKLAGILVEVLPDGRHIVGIGVNTNCSAADAPEQLRPRVVTLRDLAGHAFEQTEILVSLLQRLESSFGRLAGNSEEIAARADGFCLQRGQSLTVEQGGQQITGRYLGIGRDGALRLETPEGVRTFYSGVLVDRAHTETGGSEWNP
jgi:BirA family transcriptional regulator, biotin operon repressor / biotin---[acetyl-CoA-carboxylase] ligase